MSKKSNLKELHAKLKEWCDDGGDRDMENLLSQLKNEIDEMADEENDDTGGNHPNDPPGKP